MPYSTENYKKQQERIRNCHKVPVKYQIWKGTIDKQKVPKITRRAKKWPEITRSDTGNVVEGGDVGDGAEGGYEGDKGGRDDGGDGDEEGEEGEEREEGEGKTFAGERTGPLKVVQDVLADLKNLWQEEVYFFLCKFNSRQKPIHPPHEFKVYSSTWAHNCRTLGSWRKRELSKANASSGQFLAQSREDVIVSAELLTTTPTLDLIFISFHSSKGFKDIEYTYSLSLTFHVIEQANLGGKACSVCK